MTDPQFSSVKDKYNEILFVGDANERHLKLMLLIHAINLSLNLKCVGSIEDDPDEQCILPKNWKSN